MNDITSVKSMRHSNFTPSMSKMTFPEMRPVPVSATITVQKREAPPQRAEGEQVCKEGADYAQSKAVVKKLPLRRPGVKKKKKGVSGGGKG